MEKVKSYEEDEKMQKVEVAMTGSSSRSRIFEMRPMRKVPFQHDVWRMLKNKKYRVYLKFDILIQKQYRIFWRSFRVEKDFAI